MLAVVLMGLAGAPPDVGDAARTILRNGRYQTELPRPRSSPDPGTDQVALTGRDAGRSPSIVLPSLALIAGAALIGIVVVAMALAWMLRRRRATIPPSGLGVGRAPPPRPRKPRRASADDAEALARQGRFAEAIHALLLLALAELGARSGSPAASPARTSREVLRGAGLAPEARAALSPLVAAVEWAHFGGRTAGPEDYAACDGHYRRFREAWRATA